MSQVEPTLRVFGSRIRGTSQRDGKGKAAARILRALHGDLPAHCCSGLLHYPKAQPRARVKAA